MDDWSNRHNGASYSDLGQSQSWMNCLFYCLYLPLLPEGITWKWKLPVHDFPLLKNFSVITAEGVKVLKNLQTTRSSSFEVHWKIWFKSLGCHCSFWVRVCWSCNPSQTLFHSWNKNNINYNPDQKELLRKTDINNNKALRICLSQNTLTEWTSFPQ